MKKTLCVMFSAMAFCLIAAGAWAQAGREAPQEGDVPNEPKKEAPENAALVCDSHPFAIGLSVGTDITAVCFYNYQFQTWRKDLGLTVSLGAMKVTQQFPYMAADALVMLQYKFLDGNLDKNGNFYDALYLFIQAGYVARMRLEENYPIYNQYVPLGVGIGFEPVYFRHFSFPVEVGFDYHLMTGYMGMMFSAALRYRL
jgi:hypothetical protein